VLCIMDIMKKSIKFYKAIKKHKKKLLKLGYPLGTINAWMYGARHPSYEKAIELSPIIELLISDIPYRQVIVNER